LSAARRVLVLGIPSAAADEIAAMAEALAAQGASVVVRSTRDDYDALLDAIALADTVICWK
jgi:NAD(P)-dependent dehydrogenase (short-subunit alcohol dehydrogenase family)